MSAFSDPSFFILLAATIVVAAVLGLREKPLKWYGLGVSILFFVGMFYLNITQLLYATGFIVLVTVATQWLFRDPKSKVRFIVALIAVLGPLITYKISAVFDSNLLGFLGISYLTFKATQVVIETHDGLIDHMKPLDYLYFIMFFPVFTSGPIDRSRRFMEDADKVYSHDEYAGLLARGIMLLLLGMAYKIILAAIFYRYWSPGAWGTDTFSIEFLKQVKTAYIYGFYLFFDFAGYSLMAMGASYCLGIRTPRNFRAPFIAVDIKDFWNRWHMTLSFWLRDFVFMRFSRFALHHKLFKSRLTTACMGFIVNMWVMGMWHGLTADYLLYGLYHGLLLAGCEAYQKKSKFYKKHKDATWYKICSWFININLVFLGFALFSGQIRTAIGL